MPLDAPGASTPGVDEPWLQEGMPEQTRRPRRLRRWLRILAILLLLFVALVGWLAWRAPLSRALEPLPTHALVKEYTPGDITSFPATGTTNPAVTVKSALGDAYRESLSRGFTDWQLPVEGLVAMPRPFSLADLKRLPSRTQITRHTCEEGWTAIGQWTGVPLSVVPVTIA